VAFAEDYQTLQLKFVNVIWFAEMFSSAYTSLVKLLHYNYKAASQH